MKSGLGMVALIVIALVLIYVSISGYVDCFSTSHAETLFGKLADCAG